MDSKDLILMNMRDQNLISAEDYSESIFYTMEKEYTIYFIRNKTRFPTNFKYLCKWIFLNDLKIEVFQLLLSEMDIMIILDNLYQYNDYQLESIQIPISTIDTIYHDSYFIRIYRNKNVYNNSYLEILSSKTNMRKIKFELDEESLYSFMDLLYFTFLFDISESYLEEITEYLHYHDIV